MLDIQKSKTVCNSLRRNTRSRKQNCSVPMPMARTAQTATWINHRISLLTLGAIKYRLEDILKTDVDVIHGPLPQTA